MISRIMPPPRPLESPTSQTNASPNQTEIRSGSPPPTTSRPSGPVTLMSSRRSSSPARLPGSSTPSQPVPHGPVVVVLPAAQGSVAIRASSPIRATAAQSSVAIPHRTSSPVRTSAAQSSVAITHHTSSPVRRGAAQMSVAIPQRAASPIRAAAAQSSAATRAASPIRATAVQSSVAIPHRPASPVRTTVALGSVAISASARAVPTVNSMLAPPPHNVPSPVRVAAVQKVAPVAKSSAAAGRPPGSSGFPGLDLGASRPSAAGPSCGAKASELGASCMQQAAGPDDIDISFASCMSVRETENSPHRSPQRARSLVEHQDQAAGSRHTILEVRACAEQRAPLCASSRQVPQRPHIGTDSKPTGPLVPVVGVSESLRRPSATSMRSPGVPAADAVGVGAHSGQEGQVRISGASARTQPGCGPIVPVAKAAVEMPKKWLSL